jgi:hypothetical protein
VAGSRAELAGALEDAGLTVVPEPSARFSPPVVVLEGAAPWVTGGTRDGALRVAWRLTCIAGRTSAEGVFAQLDALVDEVIAAVRDIRRLELGELGPPTARSAGEIAYLTASLDVVHVH